MFNNAHGGAIMSVLILRLPEIKRLSGLSRSTIYLRISQGLMTKPISLGGRAVGWPSNEVAAINNARVAGKSDVEIKALVALLTSKRGEALA